MGVSHIEFQHLWNGLWVERKPHVGLQCKLALFWFSMAANQNFFTLFSGIANFNKISETVYGTEGEVIFTYILKQASNSMSSQPLNPSSPHTNCFTSFTDPTKLPCL
jgi:hypothetical protein